jgi:hypothetical protein
MSQRPPFDMLRACFWLVAFMVGVVMLIIAGTTGACILGIATGWLPVGHCLSVGLVQFIRDWWTDILATILALLAVSRLPPPPPSEK